MSTVTVYQYEIYDRETLRWLRAQEYATLEYIASIGAVPLTGLRWVVDASRVDEKGQLVKPPADT